MIMVNVQLPFSKPQLIFGLIVCCSHILAMLEHNIERRHIYTQNMTTNIQASEVAESTFLAEVLCAAHLFPNVREF